MIDSQATHVSFPSAMENDDVLFALKSQKFIEFVRNKAVVEVSPHDSLHVAFSPAHIFAHIQALAYAQTELKVFSQVNAFFMSSRFLFSLSFRRRSSPRNYQS